MRSMTPAHHARTIWVVLCAIRPAWYVYHRSETLPWTCTRTRTNPAAIGSLRGRPRVGLEVAKLGAPRPAAAHVGTPVAAGCPCNSRGIVDVLVQRAGQLCACPCVHSSAALPECSAPARLRSNRWEPPNVSASLQPPRCGCGRLRSRGAGCAMPRTTFGACLRGLVRPFCASHREK